MRLRHIEVFHAVYSSGSVTAAARMLNVSQPSVSKVLAHAEQQLGYPLPVSSLHYWVRGLPNPDADHTVLSGGFRQSGWQVSYPARGAIGPEQVLVTRDDMRLRLAGLKWQL